MVHLPAVVHKCSIQNPSPQFYSLAEAMKAGRLIIKRRRSSNIINLLLDKVYKIGQEKQECLQMLWSQQQQEGRCSREAGRQFTQGWQQQRLQQQQDRQRKVSSSREVSNMQQGHRMPDARCHKCQKQYGNQKLTTHEFARKFAKTLVRMVKNLSQR